MSWKSEPTLTDGEYVEGADNNKSIECRAVPNGEGVKVAGIDGDLIDFSFTVFMPKNSPVPYGSSAVITRNGVEVGKGTIKRMITNQLHSVAWL